MKIIVISGSYSNVGKTTLAHNIMNELNSSRIEMIKIGHNKAKPTKTEALFNDINEGLNYIYSLQASNKVDYLIVESNSIYQFLKPDLAIFIMNNAKPEKETAQLARQFADIIIDNRFDYEQAKTIIINKIGEDFISPALKNQYRFMFENLLEVNK